MSIFVRSSPERTRQSSRFWRSINAASSNDAILFGSASFFTTKKPEISINIYRQYLYRRHYKKIKLTAILVDTAAIGEQDIVLLNNRIGEVQLVSQDLHDPTSFVAMVVVASSSGLVGSSGR
jgi:hypothetical protein